MRKAVLIYNPSAGQRCSASRRDRVLSLLRRGGFDLEACPTRSPGDATTLTREAVDRGVEVVFGLGGDGTLREISVGLMGTPVALGILPGGTGNVLTFALGLPRDIEEAAAALCDLPARPMDVGLCNSTPFLMMASAGLDSHTVAHLNGDLKGSLGVGGVVLQGLAEWLGYSYPVIEVAIDDEVHEATLVLVANIAHYGGGYLIAPEARFDDGVLDVMLFKGRGRRSTLSFAVDVTMEAHQHRSDVEFFRSRHVAIRGPSGVPVQIDGDDKGHSAPVEVRLAREKVMVLGKLLG